MQERRHHKRYTSDFIKIRGGIPFADNVKILDISLSGVLFETDRKPDIGNRYVLSIESERNVLTVQGTVVRSISNKNNEDSGEDDMVLTYKAGLHFTKLSNEKIIEIAKFVKEYVLDDQKQKIRLAYIYKSDNPKLYMRFLTENPMKISSHDPHIYYKVKNINLSGMLIESTQEMDIDQTLMMEITLTDKEVISFFGRIVLCILREDVGAGMYDIGIEFIDMSEQNLRILNEYIFFFENRYVYIK